MSLSKLGSAAITVGMLAISASVHAQEAPPVEATTVHLDGSDAAVLQLQAGPTAKSWVDVCASPCDMLVPAGGLYRINGSGIRTSRSFMLDRSTGRVVLDVRPSSTAAYSLGLTGAIVGSVAALVGLGLIVWPRLACSMSHRPCEDSSGLLVAGLVTLGVGGGLAIAGGVVMANNGRSDVTQHATPAATAPPPVAARLPIWNEREVVPSTPWAVTVASGTF